MTQGTGGGAPQSAHGRAPQEPAHGWGPPRRTNPVAGALTVLGGLMALAQALLPWGKDQLLLGENPIGVVGAARVLQAVGDGGVEGSQAWKIPVFAVTIIVSGILGLLTLIVGLRFFARATRHTGVAVSGVINAVLLCASGAFSGIASNWQLFDGGTFAAWLLLLAGVPGLIGALVGFSR